MEVGASVLILLREGAELLIILAAFRKLLIDSGRHDLLRALRTGVLLGALLTAVAVAGFAWSEPGKLTVSILTLVCAIGVLAVVTGYLRSTGDAQRHVRKVASTMVGRRRGGVIVAAFAALILFREGAEAAIALHAMNDRLSLGGLLAGASIAAAMLYAGSVAWQRIKDRHAIQLLYRISALLLSVVAVEMLLDGLFGLMQAGVLPFDDHWVEAVRPFAAGGALHAGLCAVLAALPIAMLIRAWWLAADASPGDKPD